MAIIDDFGCDGCVAQAELVRRQLEAELRRYREEERELAERVPRRATYRSQVRRAVEIRERREVAVADAVRRLDSIPETYRDLDGEWIYFGEALNDIQCGGDFPAVPLSRPYNLRDLGWRPTWRLPDPNCPYYRQSRLDVEAKFVGGRVLTEEELSVYGLTIRDISREHLLAMVDREMFVPREAYRPLHPVGGGRFWLCGVATHADGRPWGRWVNTAHEGRARA